VPRKAKPVRRAHGTGSIREDERGYFQAAPPPGIVPGRPKRRFPTKDEAQAWLDEIMDQARKGLVSSAKETVKEFADRWLSSRERDLRENTLADYRKYVDLLIVPELGKLRMASVQPKHIERALVSWHKRGVTRYQTRRGFVVLKTMFRTAMRLQVIPPRNPVDGVTPPRYQGKPRPRWSGADIAAFQKRHFDDPLYPYVHVALTTGLRREELLGLRWQDVDLRRRVLRIEQTVTFVNGSPRFGETKTEKSQREMFVDAGTVAALERQREQVTLLRDFAGKRWKEHDLVFPAKLGGPYGESDLAGRFRVMCDEAGVTRITPYGTRHTYGSLAHESEKVTDKLFSERMGHTTVAFTLRQYVHTSEEHRRRAALTLEELAGIEREEAEA
jgi:integrase